MLKKFEKLLPVVVYSYFCLLLVSCIFFIAYGIQIHFSKPIVMGTSGAALTLALFIIFYHRSDLKKKFEERKFHKVLYGIAWGGFSGYALFDFLMIFLCKVDVVNVEGAVKTEVVNSMFIHGLLMLLLALLTYLGYKIIPEKMKLR